MSKEQPPSPTADPAWRCRDRCLILSPPGVLMGILNVTPDSFSDGGSFLDLRSASLQARRMLQEGASIIDVGGESTRPGAAEVPAAEELARVLPVIHHLAAHEPAALISIDTSKAPVAQAALAAGVHIINDVTALRGDPDMARLAAATGAGLVLMHMQGSPRTMQARPHYEDVVREVREFFEERLDSALAAGISLDRIALDPGIGFGKTLEHNLALLRHLDELSARGRPLLLGVSRKSLFQQLLGLPLEDRVLPTALVTAFASTRGVAIHRVHDVAENRIALALAEALGA